jgi:hypothetical protein
MWEFAKGARRSVDVYLADGDKYPFISRFVLELYAAFSTVRYIPSGGRPLLGWRSVT